jgi:hypothetical protein
MRSRSEATSGVSEPEEISTQGLPLSKQWSSSSGCSRMLSATTVTPSAAQAA